MNRSRLGLLLLIPLALLLLPGPAGRLILNLLGGITVLLLLLPLVLIAVGYFAMRQLTDRVSTCPNCGLMGLSSELNICPACGWRQDVNAVVDNPSGPMSGPGSILGQTRTEEISASEVTITVSATRVVDETTPE
ncbi:MAG: hypothetical protein ACKN89_16400 [Cyanobium sp.]|jgi:hypothetical protein